MLQVIFDESRFSKLHYNNIDYGWAGYFSTADQPGEIVTAFSQDKMPGIWQIELGRDQLYRIHARVQCDHSPAYFLCFYPGSQGRFLNQLLCSLLSNNFKGAMECRAGFNSWHHARQPSVTAVATHDYPNWTVVRSRDYLNENKFVLIKFDYDDVAEIHANMIYKNIIQDLSVYPDQYGNFELSKEHEIFQQLYGLCTLENFAKIFATDHDKLQTVIKFDLDNYLLNFNRPELMIKTEFITGTVDHDQTLVINFKDLYTRSATGYVALDKICDFFNVPVAKDAVKLFDFNAASRINLIKKYFYKLDINC